MIDKRKNVVFDDTPIKCDKCGGRYIFQGAGKYICEDCGNVVYDDFGKVKAYIDEHGPSPGIVISEATGVSINKINIHNRFKQYSYLDIMLNPAGGMPFMYAMSLVSIPQYVFMLIQFIHPENKWTSGAIKALTVGQPLWLVVYLVMLFVLGLAFAFVNVSGEQISDRMRKSGEYIYGVYPGQETSAYINHLVLRLGFIGALYMLFMAGAPMLIILVNPDYLQLSMIPGTFLIFSGMIYNVNEEMKALKLNTSYTPLFENV